MVIGAWIALFKDDLKALLAFSTVSHLGLITMLFGFGTPIAAVAAVFHILNHATFKAALFMSAGIVDHETGTRDVRRLGGLLCADADHRHAGADRRRLDGRRAAAQRLPVQGDDARGGGAHRLCWACPGWCRRWRRWARCFSVAYSVRFVVARLPGPGARRLPASRRTTRRAGMWLPVAVLVVPVVADRPVPVPLVEPVVERRRRRRHRRHRCPTIIWRSGTGSRRRCS